MIWSKEIPAAFIANNSNRSPKLPKVINDANKIANGKAKNLLNSIFPKVYFMIRLAGITFM